MINEKLYMLGRVLSIVCIIIGFVLAAPLTLCAQTSSIDSLRTQLEGISDDDTVKVDQLLELYNLYRRAGRQPEAAGALDQARILAEKQGHSRGLARTKVASALRTSYGGDANGAIALLDKAWEDAKASGDAACKVQVLRARGIVYMHSAHFDSAFAAFDHAMVITSENADSTSYYDILNLIGVVYHDQGKMNEASKHFYRCLVWAERSDDKKKIAEALVNLGNSMSGFSPDQALHSYTRAAKLLREQQDIFGLSCALNSIALMQITRNEMDEAERSFLEAIQGFERLEVLSHQLASSTGYASMLQRSGRIEEAIARYHTNISLARRVGNRSSEAHTMINLGTAYQCVGDLQQAWEYAINGYRITEELGRMEQSLYAAKLLSDLAVSRGDVDKAFFYYKKFIATRDSVQGKETQQKIHAMREQYEAGVREKEIHSLRQESEMQSLMLVNQRNDLALRTAESDRRMQQLLLMERDRDIDALELERRQHELLIERSEREKREQQLQLLDGDSKLKASLLDKQLVLRNALLGTILLLLLLSAVSISRHRHKRKLIALRMRAAELQAQSAEAESMRLAAEKDRQEKEMQRAFSQQLIESQEQERKRIAGELHDSLGQGLLVIRNRAFLAKERLADPEKLSEQLDIIAETAAGTLSEVRQISRALRPYQLDRFGLTAAIEGLTTSVSEASSLRIDTAIEGIDGVLPQHAEINVFRVIQEAISNILKHAEASEASLRIRRENRHIAIEIRDNGKGFDAEPLWSGKLPEGAGLGLQGMIERIRMLDGSITIHSQPAAGTAVHIELPLSAGTDSPEQSASVEVAAAPAAGREAET